MSNDPEGANGTFAALMLDAVNTELPLDKGASIPFDFPLYIWYEIWVKSTVEGNPATANCWLNAR